MGSCMKELMRRSPDWEYGWKQRQGWRDTTRTISRLALSWNNKKYFPYLKGKYTYYLGLNKLSDRLPEEKAALNGYKRKIKDTSKIEFFKMHKTTNFQAPQEIDWRDLGGVTEVNYNDYNNYPHQAIRTSLKLHGQLNYIRFIIYNANTMQLTWDSLTPTLILILILG